MTDTSAGRTEIDWEPTEEERVYRRHPLTQERGYEVRRGGRMMIRIAGREEDILRPLTQEWIVDREHRPLVPHQIAKIAFIADCALCGALGLHELARRDFVDLNQEAKINFMKVGPTKPREGIVPRKRLWNAIHVALDGAAK